jgi:RNA polymerase sigma-70 factor (ECF subfamily)
MSAATGERVAAMRTDEELMLAYAGGDQAAFRELFARLAPVLVRVVQRTVGRPADAQDIVQHTFLQLHRARKDYKADMKARPWIITIAMNLARDLLRRRGRRPEANIDDVVLADPKANAGLATDQADTAATVRAALDKLPKDQREVIVLHWFEDLSFNEIAAIVDASPGAVRVRAHRGYEALRKSLGSVSNIPALSDVG